MATLVLVAQELKLFLMELRNCFQGHTPPLAAILEARDMWGLGGEVADWLWRRIERDG